MQFNLWLCNFSGSDIAEEERYYLDYHVELIKRAPGIQCYYSGRVVATEGGAERRLRAAIVGFADSAAARTARDSQPWQEAIADGRAHFTDMIYTAALGEEATPFPARKPGGNHFIWAAEFDLAGGPAGLAAADRHYLDVHVPMARRLPGLRHYLIGKLSAADNARTDRYRSAILVFDSQQALHDAFASPIGTEILRDRDASIRNTRAWQIEAFAAR